MSVNSSELFEMIKSEINRDRMVQYVTDIGQWHRYTGTAQGEACVDYLIQNLRNQGIPVTVEKYQALVSLPLFAELTIEQNEKMRLIADVYSSPTEQMTGKLVYDCWSEKKKHTQLEQKERFTSFRDRVVLTHESGGLYAEQLFRAGALGMIHISSSKGGYIHHSNIGAEWGTPEVSKCLQIVSIPSAGISYEDGEKLKRRLSSGDITVQLTIRMDTQVRTSRMPVVDIPGLSNSFVLVNGHYDSWYEGITDNATSDAILLELAAAFWKHRNQLNRGIRIAWWSGHSDARYAGSAWYCDHHWKELNAYCVADINLDLTGCRNSRQVRARTTCMEGEDFTADLIREYTGMKARPYIPMIRGADQSFWGVHIPINIMLKYEPTDDERVSPCPSGGPWWHTSQDTIDKMDADILLRDALMNAKMACLVTNSITLPVKMYQFITIMKQFLGNIRKDLNDDFPLADVFRSLNDLEPWIVRLEDSIQRYPNQRSDRVIKEVAGELTRLVYTSGSPYQQDRSTPYLPFGNLANAKGMTRENTSEEFYLFQTTEFCRSCNRICGQIDGIILKIHQYLDVDI